MPLDYAFKAFVFLLIVATFAAPFVGGGRRRAMKRRRMTPRVRRAVQVVSQDNSAIPVKIWEPEE